MPEMVDPKEKAETRTLSLPRGDWEYLAARGTATKTDRSKYVRTMIEKDRSGIASAPEATAPDILVELCERLRPEIAGELSHRISVLDQTEQTRNPGAPALSQPRVLAALLEALLTSLAGVPLPSYDRPLAIADRELLDAVVRSVHIGDEELAIALVQRAFDFSATARRVLSQGTRQMDAESFTRRWRAELGLPYFTPLQAVAEEPHTQASIPKRPPRPPSTGTTP